MVGEQGEIVFECVAFRIFFIISLSSKRAVCAMIHTSFAAFSLDMRKDVMAGFLPNTGDDSSLYPRSHQA